MPSCILTISPITSIINSVIFFLLHPATTEIYTLSLHDALPISPLPSEMPCRISQVAPVTLVFSRLSEKTDVTVHPPPVTLKSDQKSTRLNFSHRTMSYFVCSLTKIKSPLYQSGPEPPGVHVGDP